MSSTVDDAARPDRRRRLFDRRDPGPGGGGRASRGRIERRSVESDLSPIPSGDLPPIPSGTDPDPTASLPPLDPLPSDLLTLDPDLTPVDLCGVDDLCRERIERRRTHGVDVVVKRANGGMRSVLQREAAVLEAVDGDEVVRIISYRRFDQHDELHTIDAGRAQLADPWGATPERRAAAFAEGCSALARLHAAGWFHGAVSLDHLVVDSAGTTRWCSLGSAGRILRPADTDLDKVAVTRAAHRLARSLPHARSLRRRLHRLGDDAEPRRLARIFRNWSRRARRSGQPRFDRLPQRLRDLSLPTDRLELAERTDRLRWRRIRRFDPAGRPGGRLPRAEWVIVAVTLPVLTATTLGIAGRACTSPEPPGGTTAPAAPAEPPGPSGSPEPSGPTVEMDGRRGAVGRTGDVAVVSDLDCDGADDLLVLRPSTGEIFDFERSDSEHSDDGAGGRQGRLVHRDRSTVSVEPTAPCGPAIARRSDGTSTAIVSP